MKNILRTIVLELGRTLLKLAADRALRKELPAIFATLDVELPYMLLNKAAPAAVEAMITGIIEEKTGSGATTTQLNTVLGLYDPIKAAIRNIKR
jgi:hypothetical protein